MKKILPIILLSCFILLSGCSDKNDDTNLPSSNMDSNTSIEELSKEDLEKEKEIIENAKKQTEETFKEFNENIEETKDSDSFQNFQELTKEDLQAVLSNMEGYNYLDNTLIIPFESETREYAEYLRNNTSYKSKGFLVTTGDIWDIDKAGILIEYRYGVSFDYPLYIEINCDNIHTVFEEHPDEEDIKHFITKLLDKIMGKHSPENIFDPNNTKVNRGSIESEKFDREWNFYYHDNSSRMEIEIDDIIYDSELTLLEENIDKLSKSIKSPDILGLTTDYSKGFLENLTPLKEFNLKADDKLSLFDYSFYKFTTEESEVYYLDYLSKTVFDDYGHYAYVSFDCHDAYDLDGNYLSYLSGQDASLVITTDIKESEINKILPLYADTNKYFIETVSPIISDRDDKLYKHGEVFNIGEDIGSSDVLNFGEYAINRTGDETVWDYNGVGDGIIEFRLIDGRVEATLSSHITF